MSILVLNTGSSSLKYELFAVVEAGAGRLASVAEGLVERIGEAGKPAAFDPAVHDAAEYLETGTPATVEAPGWQVRGERGAYVVRKALIGRQ